MPKINCYFAIIATFFTIKTVAQTVEISGRVISKTDVENIHVINKTAKVFTVTTATGNFTITAKVNDTLQFSSILHGVKDIKVSQGTIISKTILVNLDEQVNQLDQVVVGKVLTGNLISDIENAKKDRPINFYDVGIPGYTGKIATQSERRLSEASSLNPSIGFGGSVGFTPLINAITGRTKMLKQRVELENRDQLMRHIKSKLAADFLLSNPLENDEVNDFFYFCSEDENFLKHCKNQSDFKILIFLRMKYKQYQANKQTTDN